MEMIATTTNTHTESPIAAGSASAGFGRALGVAATFAMVAAQIAPLPLPGLATIGVAPAAAQYNARPVNITCMSQGNSAQTCRLPENTQSVSFIGPDRSGRCREGETWRRQGNNLQVSRGCGGIFEAMVYYGGGSGGGNWGGNQGGNWGGNWGGNPGGNWGGSGASNQAFAGEITCRSREGRTERCSASTGNRVQMLQQYSSSPCIEGRTWSYTNNRIEVRNGCQARFGYGYGNASGGGWGGSNQGFANQLECRSDNNRYRRCAANTQGRAEMLRQLSSSTCTQGRSWGYDRSSIWVDNGCQARFGYGYGNLAGDTSGSNGGSNTGAVIGGVALAAGLVALLAAAGKKSSGQSSSNAAASIDADLAKFPSDARVEAQLCMNEAARQVGSTGGTRVSLVRVDQAQRSAGGWLLVAQVSGTWPDSRQSMTMDCRANGSKVTAFDIR